MRYVCTALWPRYCGPCPLVSPKIYLSVAEMSHRPGRIPVAQAGAQAPACVDGARARAQCKRCREEAEQNPRWTFDRGRGRPWHCRAARAAFPSFPASPSISTLLPSLLRSSFRIAIRPYFYFFFENIKSLKLYCGTQENFI